MRLKKVTRTRRSKVAIAGLREALYRLLAEDHPMTVRQVFYQMVGRGHVDKTEKEYKSTVCRLLALMRREEQIPFNWIADNTRWQRKPRTHGSMEEALYQTATYYRRDLWNSQESYVEVWLEKDALAGVLYEITSRWHVPLMVSKGFSSLSYLYEAAETIKNVEKPAYLYYFGDRDPSGVHIDRAIEADLRKFAPNAEIHFQRMAVTLAQIEELGLPTRPTKRTDSRCKGFEGDSVEVDAIPPKTIRAMVEQCITQHIDQDALERLKTIERAERDVLMKFANVDAGRLQEIAEELDL